MEKKEKISTRKSLKGQQNCDFIFEKTSKIYQLLFNKKHKIRTDKGDITTGKTEKQTKKFMWEYCEVIHQKILQPKLNEQIQRHIL